MIFSNGLKPPPTVDLFGGLNESDLFLRVKLVSDICPVHDSCSVVHVKLRNHYHHMDMYRGRLSSQIVHWIVWYAGTHIINFRASF